MSQFMLVRGRSPAGQRLGVRLEPISEDDDLFREVARLHFRTCTEVFRVTDESGRTELLIDDVWEARQQGKDLSKTALVQLLSALVRESREFLCWCGSDYEKLPIVRSWPEMERELRSQTLEQPADLWVHYLPPSQ